MAGPLNHYAETSERALSVLPSRQQHTRSVHQSCSSINGVALVELEKPANISCDLAEDGRRRREGRTGTNEALTFEHHVGHLPAVRARKPAAGSRQTEPFGELNCDRV